MEIFFQARNMELDPLLKEAMANRIHGLQKFFSVDAQAFVDIHKTRASNNGDDLYYSSITINDGPHRYFSEDYQSDPQMSFNHSYGEIFRIIRDDRSKSRSLLRRAGNRMKKIFKRGR